MISNKFPYGKKGYQYFIGYKKNEKNNRLQITLPKMINTFPKSVVEAKYMSLLIKKEKLLKKT